MPTLTITLPPTGSDDCAALARDLTQAFAAATPFEAEIFSIVFRPYAPGACYTGGVPATDAGEGAFAHYELAIPRMRRGWKQAVVTDFSRIHRQKFGVDPVIHITEHPYDNVGVGGQLLSDAYAACADRPYYYPLPRD